MEATPPPATRSSRKRLVRRCLWVALAVVVALIARPTWHLVSTMLQDVDERTALAPDQIDDASGLNRTAIAEFWPVPDDDAERQIAELLARARRDSLPVAIAGARHSMGGHTIAPDGIVIDMRPFHEMQLDPERDILTVGSGAMWSDIIPFLDSRGRSVAVLQSNSSFSVGGSISVNCHGWVYGKPPICSTVESFRLMLGDGTVRRCARDENAELFSLVLGGYGLFGVILDVELRVVPNEAYRMEQIVVPTGDAMARFSAAVDGREDVAMFYGRMNVDPANLFDECILGVIRRAPGTEPPALEPIGFDRLRRAVFRGSAGSDYGKRLRWRAETRLQSMIGGKIYSRNQLISEGVEMFENRSGDTTDILHEYFVPHAAAAEFIDRAREIISRHDCELLNVTIRNVNEDRDTFLRYADQRMMAFVMLFHQRKTTDAEREMERLTRALIDTAVALGGRHYLPYRLHATKEQFHAAYPQAREFFARKRHYDPDELFQNQFYRRYGSPDNGRRK